MRARAAAATASAAAIIASAPDLLDPYALDRGESQPDPINWAEDLHPPNGISIDPPISQEASGPPAARLALVPARRQSLLDHIGDVDAIYDTLEGLDAEDLDEAAEEELGQMLISAIAGTKAKIDSSCSVLAAFDAAEAAAKADEERLAKRRKYFVRQRERLETYLLFVLGQKNLKRMDGNTSAISVRLNPAKLIIDSEAAIPAEFWRTPEPPPPPADVPDNARIKAALKGDPGAVPGCHLVQAERLVRS